ncbi:putative ABC transport system permease protein [Chitinophaga skermanii]|uniref:Putative ABC transport system permease protein n=1 Tax=Chitinophaga skermanii TaxID=331697 RepID=A0A327QJI0_9BACT|nr:ABC transporter permease [Chitinophaga skermanii]RAJ03884.1 putative ABC transport system permease protein [Chitinophaga skermanii]
MILNNFKIAYRNIKKQKLYSLINIGGLTLGLSISIMLLLWVQDEFSYDKMHSKFKNIYIVGNVFERGEQQNYNRTSPAGIAAYAPKEMTGLKEIVRVGDNYDYYLQEYNGKRFYESNMGYVDSTFFRLFDFELISGNRFSPFPNIHSIIMTESTAKRYFGDAASAVGKVITAEKKTQFTVVGVMKDFPNNSSIKYDILFPVAHKAALYTANDYWSSLDNDFGNWAFNTYVELAPGANLKAIGDQLGLVQHRYNKYDRNSKWFVQPMSMLHLYNNDGSDGAIRVVRIFLIVAIVIILIACINYVNLSTARASQRTSEVGLRKVVGATRFQLFGQFMGESTILFVVSIILALVAVPLMLPYYNTLTQKSLTFSLFNMQMLWVVVSVILFTILIAGIYPASLLSSFSPLKALRGSKGTVGSNNASFRKILVVVQFFISTVLIIATLVIAFQMKYIHSKELGFDKSNTITFGGGALGGEKATITKNEIAAIPGVMAVAAANQNIMTIGHTTGDTDWEGRGPDESMMVHPFVVDENVIPMMGVKMIAGRNFMPGLGDTTGYILNETALRLLGYEGDPIGRYFSLWEQKGTIIGIVKDFHMSSLHAKIEPVVFTINPNRLYYYHVKITPGKEKQVIEGLEKIYKRGNPDYPFEYKFMDEQYNNMYQAEQRTGWLFNYFAGIAIFLSCLGLFGLVTFSTAQRFKEIGIRKALGASVGNIVTLLSKDFLKLVIISIVIAVPAAYYFMNIWLQEFAYHISLQAWMFIVAGAVAIAIALFTISFQSIKAALVNPVKSLRSE